MKILITGGNGYIAKSIHSYLYSKYDITLASRADVDFTNREAVKEYFKDKYFDVVIHAAIKGGSRLNPNEESNIVFENLLMYDNLMRCRTQFNKFIHFGSGAEDLANTPYGFSKHIINKLMQLDPKSVNIKIYAVFDENELNTRFIKSNIIRYINKEDIIIHQDKKMDFFYMKDLISLIEWLINSPEEKFPVKEINCSYLEKYSLTQIADIINSLGNHKVNIIVENEGLSSDYYSSHPIMPFKLIGLEKGIKNIYQIFKNDL
jgi:nucleoside-diphosphate-sugar epimerase